MKKKINEIALVTLGYLILTFIFTYPLFLNLNDSLAPVIRGDYAQNLWNFWWVKKALINEHTNPYFTNYLFSPVGTSLAFHSLTLYNSLLAIPLQFFFDLLTVYNILIIHCFILSGIGTYLLAEYLTNDKLTAFVAGIIFSFCPYHTFRLDQIASFSIQWIPFFILYFFKLMDKTKKKYAFLCALFFTLTSICHWYYGIFLIFLVYFHFYFTYSLEKIMFYNLILLKFFFYLLFYQLL